MLLGSYMGQIKNHIPEIVDQRGMSIKDLERKTGLAYGTVWRLCSGDVEAVTMATLGALCKALNVKVGDLFEYIEDRPS
jgi:DNA-binding Xre family transcriptional regulator